MNLRGQDMGKPSVQAFGPRAVAPTGPERRGGGGRGEGSVGKPPVVPELRWSLGAFLWQVCDGLVAQSCVKGRGSSRAGVRSRVRRTQRFCVRWSLVPSFIHSPHSANTPVLTVVQGLTHPQQAK